MTPKLCERCGMPTTFNVHTSPFACVGALKQEVKRLDNEINLLSDRLLACEKELRAKGWESAIRQ